MSQSPFSMPCLLTHTCHAAYSARARIGSSAATYTMHLAEESPLIFDSLCRTSLGPIPVIAKLSPEEPHRVESVCAQRHT